MASFCPEMKRRSGVMKSNWHDTKCETALTSADGNAVAILDRVHYAELGGRSDSVGTVVD